MFTATIIQKMKQNNISVDSEKTKKHLMQTWKAASNQEQETILDLAGIARSTVHRSYRSGGISAKLAIAMGQTLDVDPFYLTGASDAPGTFALESVTLFLQTHKYEPLIPEWKKAERRQHQNASSVIPEDTNLPNPDVLAGITEEDMIILMRSLIIKAKADTHYAQQLLKLKHLLIS